MKKFMTCLMIAMAMTQISIAKKPRPKRCYSEHLKEAWRLNGVRKPLYRKLTKGKSRQVSNRLILSEKIIYPQARIFERRLFKRDPELEGLLCQIFISMTLVPDFTVAYQGGAPSVQDYIEIDIKTAQREMEKSFEDKDFETLDRLLEEQLNYLSQSLKTNCMLRHVTESSLRALRYLRNYPFKKESHRKLAFKLIKRHLSSFRLSEQLDRIALKSQTLGVPVICYDVPHIPVDI